MDTVGEFRDAILDILRRATGDLGNVITDFGGLASGRDDPSRYPRTRAVELYAALWQLVREGIIIPGHRNLGRLDNSNEGFRAFPFYTITSHGWSVIQRLRDDTDPADAARYLDALKSRAPQANAIVLRYVGESVATFNNQHYLASAVLLGVGAESLLEQMYDALAAHLGTAEADYRAKLANKRWASQRLEYARARLDPHLVEVSVDFRTRVQQYLDMLAQILKMSRDDVGHARPLRIDREVASMNLVAFPVFAGIVDELISWLQTPCILP